MAIGAKFQRTFARHVNQIGIAATYSRRSDGTYDPTTRTATATATSVNVKGVFDLTTRQDNQQDIELGRHMRERTFLIPALDVNLTALSSPPTVQDHITIGGEEYRVREVEPEYGAEVVVYFRLFLDKI